MTKKRGRTYHKTKHNNRRSDSGLCTSTVGKKTAQVPHGQPTSEAARHTTRVVQWLVCSTIFCRDLESAGDASFRRFRTANSRCKRCSSCQVWSSGRSPNARWDDVDGPMANPQPLALQVWEHNEAAAIKPCAAAGLTARAPWQRRARCRPRNVGMVEGRLKR